MARTGRRGSSSQQAPAPPSSLKGSKNPDIASKTRDNLEIDIPTDSPIVAESRQVSFSEPGAETGKSEAPSEKRVENDENANGEADASAATKLAEETLLGKIPEEIIVEETKLSKEILETTKVHSMGKRKQLKDKDFTAKMCITRQDGKKNFVADVVAVKDAIRVTVPMTNPLPLRARMNITLLEGDLVEENEYFVWTWVQDQEVGKSKVSKRGISAVWEEDYTSRVMESVNESSLKLELWARERGQLGRESVCKGVSVVPLGSVDIGGTYRDHWVEVYDLNHKMRMGRLHITYNIELVLEKGGRRRNSIIKKQRKSGVQVIAPPPITRTKSVTKATVKCYYVSVVEADMNQDNEWYVVVNQGKKESKVRELINTRSATLARTRTPKFEEADGEIIITHSAVEELLTVQMWDAETYSGDKLKGKFEIVITPNTLDEGEKEVWGDIVESSLNKRVGKVHLKMWMEVKTAKLDSDDKKPSILKLIPGANGMMRRADTDEMLAEAEELNKVPPTLVNVVANVAEAEMEYLAEWAVWLYWDNMDMYKTQFSKKKYKHPRFNELHRGQWFKRPDSIWKFAVVQEETPLDGSGNVRGYAEIAVGKMQVSQKGELRDEWIDVYSLQNPDEVIGHIHIVYTIESAEAAVANPSGGPELRARLSSRKHLGELSALREKIEPRVDKDIQLAVAKTFVKVGIMEADVVPVKDTPPREWFVMVSQVTAANPGPTDNYIFKTRVAKRSDTPKWNEEFEKRCVQGETDTLRVDLCDKAWIGKDKFKAFCLINVSADDPMVTSGWYELTSFGNIPTHGKIKLVIRNTSVEEMELADVPTMHSPPVTAGSAPERSSGGTMDLLFGGSREVEGSDGAQTQAPGSPLLLASPPTSSGTSTLHANQAAIAALLGFAPSQTRRDSQPPRPVERTGLRMRAKLKSANFKEEREWSIALMYDSDLMIRTLPAPKSSSPLWDEHVPNHFQIHEGAMFSIEAWSVDGGFMGESRSFPLLNVVEKGYTSPSRVTKKAPDSIDANEEELEMFIEEKYTLHDPSNGETMGVVRVEFIVVLVTRFPPKPKTELLECELKSISVLFRQDRDPVVWLGVNDIEEEARLKQEKALAKQEREELFGPEDDDSDDDDPQARVGKHALEWLNMTYNRERSTRLVVSPQDMRNVTDILHAISNLDLENTVELMRQIRLPGGQRSEETYVVALDQRIGGKQSTHRYIMEFSPPHAMPSLLTHHQVPPPREVLDREEILRKGKAVPPLPFAVADIFSYNTNASVDFSGFTLPHRMVADDTIDPDEIRGFALDIIDFSKEESKKIIQGGINSIIMDAMIEYERWKSMATIVGAQLVQGVVEHAENRVVSMRPKKPKKKKKKYIPKPPTEEKPIGGIAVKMEALQEAQRSLLALTKNYWYRALPEDSRPRPPKTSRARLPSMRLKQRKLKLAQNLQQSIVLNDSGVDVGNQGWSQVEWARNSKHLSAIKDTLPTTPRGALTAAVPDKGGSLTKRSRRPVLPNGVSLKELEDVTQCGWCSKSLSMEEYYIPKQGHAERPCMGGLAVAIAHPSKRFCSWECAKLFAVHRGPVQSRYERLALIDAMAERDVPLPPLEELPRGGSLKTARPGRRLKKKSGAKNKPSGSTQDGQGTELEEGEEREDGGEGRQRDALVLEITREKNAKHLLRQERLIRYATRKDRHQPHI